MELCENTNPGVLNLFYFVYPLANEKMMFYLHLFVTTLPENPQFSLMFEATLKKKKRSSRQKPTFLCDFWGDSQNQKVKSSDQLIYSSVNLPPL